MKKIILLITILLFIYSCGESNPNDDVNARVMMWQFVKGKLKDPNSADFGLCKMIKTNDGSWATDCYVDAKNGFGGNERLTFYCKVKHIEGNTWELVELNFK